jgi:hypothetical protein
MAQAKAIVTDQDYSRLHSRFRSYALLRPGRSRTPMLISNVFVVLPCPDQD